MPTDRPDRYLETEPNIPITRPPDDPGRGVKGTPGKAERRTWAAASEPYGDVEYADPGYQADGKKRYPLMDAAHCRNAWSRINDPKNAARYTADQLAKIKARIKAAGKRYGIEFADDAKKVAAAELRGIELARPGKWNLASGPMEVTDQHITDAARYAQRKGARPGYVKIGHTDKRFQVGDGEPALGWVENVRREVDDLGPKLVGDINDMPEWLAATAHKAWPYRSMEGWADYTDPDTGEKYALVLDGVALLGVTPPGMTSLQSLRDLPRAVGVAAASGVRVVASMASAPVAAEEGAGPMDPAKIREALGLSADAPDDEVGSALTVAAATLTGGDPAPAPVQASLFGDEPKPAPAPAPKTPVTVPGTVVIASSIWDETQKTIKTLTDFVAKTKRDERDDYIAKAVQAGKFTPAQRPTFMQLWDENPEYAKKAIDALMPNSALAVLASGYAGGVEAEEDELDREIARLSSPRGAHRG